MLVRMAAIKKFTNNKCWRGHRKKQTNKQTTSYTVGWECKVVQPHPEHSKRFTELYREKKREEGDICDQEEKRKLNGERATSPIIKSLSGLFI